MPNFIELELERFEEKFENIYYGKDFDGIPNYPPEGFKDDVKKFLKDSLTRLVNRMKECMPEEKTIDKKFSTDEQRYPQGFNSCRKQILENYEKRID